MAMPLASAACRGLGSTNDPLAAARSSPHLAGTEEHPAPDDGHRRSTAPGGGMDLPLEDDQDEDQDEGATLRQRLETWWPSFRPRTPTQNWLLREVVLHTIRLDRCRRHATLIRAERARRAVLSWSHDRRLAAEELGAGLAADPARTVHRLLTTTQGCDWILDRWRGLGRALETAGAWTPEQSALAFDLLGTPGALRSGPPWDSADPSTPTPGKLVARELARLEHAQAGALHELDDAERAAVESGFALEPDPELTRLHRVEADSVRQLLWALTRLTDAGRRPNPTPSHSQPARAARRLHRALARHAPEALAEGEAVPIPAPPSFPAAPRSVLANRAQPANPSASARMGSRV